MTPKQKKTPAVGAARGNKHQTKGKSSTRNRTRLGTRQEPDWPRYESLKAQYTASASTSAEYEAAIRRAAQEARV